MKYCPALVNFCSCSDSGVAMCTLMSCGDRQGEEKVYIEEDDQEIEGQTQEQQFVHISKHDAQPVERDVNTGDEEEN